MTYVTGPLRILVADDHEVVRQGVRSVLEQQPGWVVCGEARTGREAVAKAVELQPDVVITDVSMPELNGLEAARQIRRVLGAKILILTVHRSDELATEMRDAGADGYVLKSEAGRTLVEAIHAVFERGVFFAGPVQAVSSSQERPRRAAAGSRGSGRLTPRQREVLRLLTEGKSNQEIGALLGMATKTAETHRANIMAKLDLHSVSELVRYAIRNQIIEP